MAADSLCRSLIRPVPVADQRGRCDKAAAKRKRVIMPADKVSNPIAGTNGPVKCDRAYIDEDGWLPRFG
jgi:hypothetical protein